jgi:hypothetical protein
MLFLIIFSGLLVVYFFVVDPLVKRYKLKPHKRVLPVFDIIGAFIDLFRFH